MAVNNYHCPEIAATLGSTSYCRSTECGDSFSGELDSSKR